MAARTLQIITGLNVLKAAGGTNSMVTRQVDRTLDYIQTDGAGKLLSQCGGTELWMWVFSYEGR